MTESRTFVLVGICDDSLFAQWAFTAPSEFAVADTILQNPFAYPKLFWGLRLNMQHVPEAVSTRFRIH